MAPLLTSTASKILKYNKISELVYIFLFLSQSESCFDDNAIIYSFEAAVDIRSPCISLICDSSA